MGSDVTVGLAFLAGFLSFISPCVLPLIPAYVSYLTARAAHQNAGELRAAPIGGAVGITLKTSRVAVFTHGLAFISGFTLVFVGFGMILNIGIQILQNNSGLAAVQQGSLTLRDFLARAGGILVIFFGLHLMGATRFALNRLRAAFERAGNQGAVRAIDRVYGLLYADMRKQMNPRNPYGYLGSVAMGVIFAAGWSPCIGPILGSILTVAANASTGSTWLGAGGLLLFYSVGLAVPFLLAAVAIDQMRGLIKRLQRRMRAIEFVSGAFLIFVGVLLYTGELVRLSQTSGSFADFTFNLQECAAGVVRGDVPIGDWGTCMNLGPNYKYKIEAQAREASKAADPAPLNPAPINAPPLAGGSGLVDRMIGLEVGMAAPNFEVKLLNGAVSDLKAYQGKVLLLNFWATWCGPCREEMPLFQRLEASYGEHGFAVLAVNFAEETEPISAFLEENGLNLSIALDPSGAISRQFRVIAYPTTYIIGRDGGILAKQSGPFDPAALEAAIQAWLRG